MISVTIECPYGASWLRGAYTNANNDKKINPCGWTLQHEKRTTMYSVDEKITWFYYIKKENLEIV
jgi:hypothetical protein